MNKLNLIFGLMLALVATSAAAYVDVTYHFNVEDVEVAAYDILNADGSSVGPFSGEFPDGDTTSDGQLTIRYPDSLATTYGYGVYYVSSGYIPLEAVATWNTEGDDGEATLDFDLDFEQLSGCRSVVDQFSITNTAQANVPVVINMEAALDASIKSAFSLTDNQLKYVPPQFKDEHYSAEVMVTLKIYQGTTLVDTQTKELNIYADDSVPVSFSWTPTEDGEYRAEVTTTVVDNQCSSNIPATTSKDFTVQDSMPRNECYTIINGLTAAPTVGTTDEVETLSFTKISNHANDVAWGDQGYTLTAIPTTVTTQVTGPNGYNTQSSSTLAANSNNYDPSTASFTFTPNVAGLYTVMVTGVGASSLCNGIENTQDSATLVVEVKDEPTYKVPFQIRDATNNAPIVGAVVNLAGQYVMSDATGTAVVDGLTTGTYSYVITHPNYLTYSGMLTITDVDQVLFIVMTPGDGEDTPIPPTPGPGPEPEMKEVFGVYIDTIRISDAFEQTGGSEVPFLITFTNNGDKKLTHVKAVVVIQDLALRASVGPMELSVGEDTSEHMYLPLDSNVKPGVYPVRITIHGDDIDRVVYREIEVIE
jgi:hypothetical protein